MEGKWKIYRTLQKLRTINQKEPKLPISIIFQSIVKKQEVLFSVHLQIRLAIHQLKILMINPLHPLPQSLVYFPLFLMCPRRNQPGHCQELPPRNSKVPNRHKNKSAVLTDTPTKNGIAALEGNWKTESVKRRKCVSEWEMKTKEVKEANKNEKTSEDEEKIIIVLASFV